MDFKHLPGELECVHSSLFCLYHQIFIFHICQFLHLYYTCSWTLVFFLFFTQTNTQKILIHAIISLTLSHDKDQELIEHPSFSDQCLRRAACMNQRVSSMVFADTSRHKLTVDLERIRLRRIALPRLPLVLHLILILVTGGTVAYVNF